MMLLNMQQLLLPLYKIWLDANLSTFQRLKAKYLQNIKFNKSGPTAQIILEAKISRGVLLCKIYKFVLSLKYIQIIIPLFHS